MRGADEDAVAGVDVIPGEGGREGEGGRGGADYGAVEGVESVQVVGEVAADHGEEGGEVEEAPVHGAGVFA